MPVVGFIDDTGNRVTFADIAAGGGVFALPRPFVRALANGYRSADHYGDADVVSVTTLGSPVQATRLLQRHDIFVAPLRNMWAMFGTIGHGVLEAAGNGPGEVAERRLVIDFEGQLVGGTFDLIERADTESPIGQDYKVTGVYGVAQMLAKGVAKAKIEYALQANVYRYMLAQPDAREVVSIEHSDGHVERSLVPFEHAGIGERIKQWQLVLWGRDWKADKGDPEFMTVPPTGRKVRAVEMVEVPLIERERVENYLRQRITEYAAAGMCDDAGLPECTPAERWQGRRCGQWCDAAPVCAQLARLKRPARRTLPKGVDPK